LLTLLVTIGLAFPIGVLAAIYLEEFAPKNRWTDLIEVSINNLAAVPSIIFGLLGLAVFLNVFNMPRASPLVGGLTLALMTLPVIVIAARVAIKAVPPSIRDAALGVGASPVQVVFQHVLPLGLPGIMTGTIIGDNRIAVISLRPGISGRDRPNAASVPSTVARIVDQNPMITEFLAALTHCALAQASDHHALSRTPSGACMPSVKSWSYQRHEYPSGSSASIAGVKVK
jgi:hypothetical protein